VTAGGAQFVSRHDVGSQILLAVPIFFIKLAGRGACQPSWPRLALLNRPALSKVAHELTEPPEDPRRAGKIGVTGGEGTTCRLMQSMIDLGRGIRQSLSWGSAFRFTRNLMTAEMGHPRR
jgi:hypothetical protein